MSMRPELLNRVVPRILDDYAFKTSEDGQWFNQGKCPACNKRSLFTAADNPWVLRCGRENKCGAQYSIRDLYPDEFGQFDQRHPATSSNPMATADAYMSEARGLDVVHMRKHQYYTQDSWWSRQANAGTATVRFAIPGTDGSYMERFVDPVEITNADGTREIRKQNFSGPHRGLWWQPPEMPINAGDEVWIVEAIIDAISLWQNGIKAVAILSCSNYPSKSLTKLIQAKHVKWVWALDNDDAGKRVIKKFVKRMRGDNLQCNSAIAPQKSKCDWNDLHRLGRLHKDDLKDYKYYGALLIANSALDKAALMFARRQTPFFVVDFDNRLYWFTIEQKAIAEARDDIHQSDLNPRDEEEMLALIAKDAGKLQQIANVRPEFLYFQRNEITDESWFFCRINFPDGRPPVNLPFTPGQVTACAEFKKRLASAEGAWWSGEAKHLDWIGSRWLQNLKKINTIEYIGYSREHKAYILPDFAVKAGKVYPKNKDDYFDLPRDSIKTLAQDKTIKIEMTNQNYRQDWAQLVWRAFGTDGIIACVYWFGSLFAEHLRHTQSSYPFLEIIGEPGAGKSTLIEFIWKIWGREDYEGIDPNKNTFAGNQRKMTQYAAMPTVFIEADRDEDSHSKKFDWEEVKPYYNGRGLRVRGMKNSGNETYEPPFRGTLVIAQNEPVNASDAVLERIVQLRFSKANHNHDSRMAIDEMMTLEPSQLSYFVTLSCQREQQIIDHVTTRQHLHQDYLLNNTDIQTLRLAKNHAQLIALAEAFADLVGLSSDQRAQTCNALAHACADRQLAIAKDHPIVAEFWDIFDYLDSQGNNPDGSPRPLLNHSRNPNEIAVNLNEFVEQAGIAKQQMPLLRDLKRLLKTSKNRKFIESSRTVCSAIDSNKYGKPKTPRCWIFQRAAGETI
ncbi:toprim domain-containing protein [Rappaport israeli]|uniref:toprim domain-containing protein n=1 Tax=Rappaport israeli TaxID=1839807 RepID=UPI00098F7BBE|nr:toprim domain-containing protein [Rappaport israeli]